MKSKQIIFILLTFLYAGTTFSQKSYSIKKEFRSDCTGNNKTLISTEVYNTSQKVISSSHDKRKTEFIYDSNGNLIAKIHRDQSGKLLRFNKIYYNDQNEYFIDTLFNADSTAGMIFKRRHSKKANEDIITWDNLNQKGSTVIQTIKIDDMKNETENNICTSSSECTVTKNTFSGKKLIKAEVYRREEMNRKPVLIETQNFEYDDSDRLIKTVFTNEFDKMCTYELTYTYE